MVVGDGSVRESRSFSSDANVRPKSPPVSVSRVFTLLILGFFRLWLLAPHGGRFASGHRVQGRK